MFAFPNPDYEAQAWFREALAKTDGKMRRAAMDRFVPAFHDRYNSHMKAPAPDHVVRLDGEVADAALRRLQEDGYSLTRIDEAQKARLVALTADTAEGVLARLPEHSSKALGEAQALLEREEHAEVFETLDAIFTAQNLYAVASAYCGRALTLAPRAAVQVNTAAHSRSMYGEIEADGLPVEKTRYLHIDSSGWPWIKVLIYLTPVGPEQGPFRYVAGSHRLASPFELSVRKTNDKLRLPAKFFVALPEPFRMNTHFGDHAAVDDPRMEALLRNERTVCDGASDLILFDNNGVHRGGFVREGRRYMMQCFLKPEA